MPFSKSWRYLAGKTPSFRFYEVNGQSTCGCFGCRKGGNAINFVMNMENCSFTEACKLLMKWYQIEDLPTFSYKKYQQKLEAKEDLYKFKIKLEAVASLFEEAEPEICQKASLLFCNLNFINQTDIIQKVLEAHKKPLDEFLLDLDEDVFHILKEDLSIIQNLKPNNFENVRYFSRDITKSGLLEDVSQERWDGEKGRYIFPIFLPGGIPIGFSGRSLNPNILKYLTRFEFGFDKKDIFFGFDRALPAIKEKGYVIIVEGILDAVRCWSLGFWNTIAPMSTYLSEEHIIILKALTNKFILAHDNDQGGNAAAELSAKNLDKYRLLYERVLVPKDQDPDLFGLYYPQELSNLLTSKW